MGTQKRSDEMASPIDVAELIILKMDHADRSDTLNAYLALGAIAIATYVLAAIYL